MKDPDCVALLLNFIKKLEKQITQIFDNTNELKEKQIKGESHLQELGDAADFLTKKLDKYKEKRKEGQEIINNLTENVAKHKMLMTSQKWWKARAIFNVQLPATTWNS